MKIHIRNKNQQKSGVKFRTGKRTWRFVPSKASALLPAVIAALLAILMVLLCVQPKRYDLQVDGIAPETIKATREIEDSITTQQLIDEAVAAVDVRYTEDEQAFADVMRGIDEFAEACRMVRENAQEEKERWVLQEKNKLVASALEADPEAEVTPDDFDVDESEFVYTEEFLGNLAALLPDGASDEEVVELLATPGEDLEIYCRILRNCVENTMHTGVKESLLSAAQEIIMDDLAASLPELSPEWTSLCHKAVLKNVKANLLLDAEALEAAKEAAIESVTPVTYKKGENVVEEGKRITEAQYEVLRSLSLLRSDKIDYSLYLSTAAFVLLAVAMFCVYLYEFHRETALDRQKAWLLCVQLCIVMLVGYLCHFIDIRLAPLAAGAIILCVAVSEPIALAFNIAAVFLAGMMSGSGGQSVTADTLTVALAGVIGGTAGVLFLRIDKMRVQRGTLLLAGAVSGLFTGFGYLLIAMAESKGGYLTAFGYGVGSGVLAGMLALAILPMWENLFDILTPMKLMELSNPNHPLLKKLLMEASGTYHHSIVVANLAEQAADAIGADGLFARTAAYYHDVGKIKRPMFFKENQVGPENPHDGIAPELSAMILISHPTDGVALAKKYKIPNQILQVIQCHHGDTLTAYFYGKACKIAEGKEGATVHENEFRYPGPRPHSREEGVIMLADTVEAASRTLHEHTPDSIRNLVEKLVHGKFNDGQLDHTSITLREMNVLVDSFCKTLSSTYHERIEYPQLPEKKEDRA